MVRIVPNPLPLGRCAAIRVEVQDGEGYQSAQLPDGSRVDSRRFKYDISDAKSFRWQKDDPAEGYLCANADAKPSRTTVTVALAKGLSGTAELTSVAPGQAAPPVTYPAQAPLRLQNARRIEAVPATPADNSGPPAAPPSAAILPPINVPITFSGPNPSPASSLSGAIVVRVRMRNLNSTVRKARLVCRIKPPDGDWDEGVTWATNVEETASLPDEGFNEYNTTNYRPGLPTETGVSPSNPLNGQDMGAPFKATRSKPYAQGGVWAYSCSVWLGRGGQGLNAAEWTEAGSGPAFKDWAQVAVGSARAEGTFVVP
ncbi:MAG: hypothetical protein ABJD07_08970 [Gemmatimonadaceae bacterium]